MTRSEVMGCFKVLLDGAGPQVWVPDDILSGMADAANWRGYDSGYTYRNDVMICWLPLSHARDLLHRAEQRLADEVFEALST